MPTSGPSGYERRRPEETVLYRVLRDHLATFLERVSDTSLPGFVVRELRDFLDCGQLDRGFVRVFCPVCRDDLIVGLSCKHRGFCPSCCGRRMNQLAAHVVDRVIPKTPVRQWVLSLPSRLIGLVAFDPDLLGAILRATLRAIEAHYRRAARGLGIPDGRSGAFTSIQRFSSSLQLYPHFHILALDGVYSEREDAPPVFHRAPRLSIPDVERVVEDIERRATRVLARRGLLDGCDALGPDSSDQPVLHLAPGRLVRRRVHRSGGGRRRRLAARTELGYDLHAGTRVRAGRRGDLEQLVRYILRPPIAADALSLTETGEVEVRLKSPRSDGTVAIRYAPLAFIGRLACLVPRPRRHLVRYSGVLGPNAKMRSAIVPGPPAVRSCRRDPRTRGSTTYLPWALMLRRTFKFDLLVCERCGGRRSVLAAVLEPHAVRTILGHLGLPTTRERVRAARGPPDQPEPWDEDQRVNLPDDDDVAA